MLGGSHGTWKDPAWTWGEQANLFLYANTANLAVDVEGSKL